MGRRALTPFHARARPGGAERQLKPIIPAALRAHIRLGDAIVVLAILAAALLPLFTTVGEGAYAVVSVDGTVVYKAPLTRDAQVIAGGGNVFSIVGGEISMLTASCPDGLCLGMRARRRGESVVCLPNNAAAWIEGAGRLDGVAY